MAKQVVTSDRLYPVYGPYSHAVRVGDLVFLHGTVGFDARGRLPGETPGRADMVGQCRQTIENMAAALELLGGGLQDVVKVRAFLPQHCRPGRPGQPTFDETFDTVYGQYFQPPRPARAALQQGLFLEDLLVEIEAIAALNQPRRLIEAATLPPLRRPYAQGGILVGNLLFLRGFTAQNRHGDLVGRGNMRVQTEQTFANMAIVLQEAGGSLADLVQTHVTLTDWHAYQDYNEVYNRHVCEPFPTRTTLQGGLGREGLLLEIESIAALATPRLTIDSAIPQVGRSLLQRRDNVIYAEPLAPQPASYAHAVRVGDLLFISGQVSLDASGRLIGPGDIGTQTHQVLSTMQTILRLADLGLEDVVKTTVMLTDWRHYTAYNNVYRQFFAPPYPARSTVCGGLATRGALLEMEAIAVAGARHTAIVATSP
ncbi:MAG TPA: RidA family protein [Candidatus Tectomicrobia bacterium]|jgi:2-iminobutanoate/2-iminopropanoate deaminase